MFDVMFRVQRSVCTKWAICMICLWLQLATFVERQFCKIRHNADLVQRMVPVI